MIRASVEKALSEGFDGRDTYGRCFTIQIGALHLSWWITWGRK